MGRSEDNEIERMLRRKSKSPISTEESNAIEHFSQFHRGTGVSKVLSDADYARPGTHLNDGVTSNKTSSAQQRTVLTGEYGMRSSPVSNSSGMFSSSNGG